MAHNNKLLLNSIFFKQKNNHLSVKNDPVEKSDSALFSGQAFQSNYLTFRLMNLSLGLLLCITLAVSAGCGGKSVSSQKKVPDQSTGKIEDMPPPPWPEQPADKPAKPQPEPQKSDREDKKTKSAVKISPLQQMLTSAGRDPSAVQPEEGFLLELPEKIQAGQPFLVTFKAAGIAKVAAEWKNKSIELAPGQSGPEAGYYRILLPVTLSEKAKALKLALAVHWKDGKVERFTADLPVHKRNYPVQSLKVAQKYVTPPPEVQDKIKRDRAEMRAAIGKISPVRFWNLPMLRPVPGVVTSLYGLRRVFNGEERNPHTGVDFDAAEGDPIAALEAGAVVLVADHYYGGKTVVVDHGLGVFSIYLHLSAYKVSQGQKIARGETVGLIGSTGRVTGPHLHLSMAIFGSMVDAAACVDM